MKQKRNVLLAIRLLDRISFPVFSILILLLSVGMAYSETIFAEKILQSKGGGVGLEGPFLSIPTSDGGYVSASAFPWFYTWAWIKKTNSSGKRVWENDLFFEKDEFHLVAISETKDGGYVAVGGSFGLFSVIIKFGPNGDIQWKRKWSATDGSRVFFTGSVALSDGGFMVAGAGVSGGGTPGFKTYIALVRFNSSGEATAASKFTLPNVRLDIKDFVAAPDGGFFLTCNTDEAINRVLVIRLDGNTRVLWSRLFEIEKYFDPGITSTTDNGAILISTDDTSAGSLLLLRLKGDGQVEWKKRISFDKPVNVFDVTLASDGGYLITGSYSIRESFPYSIKMLLLKTDSAGNSVFARTFPYEEPADVFYGSSVSSSPDGGFLLSGSGHEPCQGSTCKYAYVFKLNSKGKVPGCNLFRSVRASSDHFGDVKITTQRISRSTISLTKKNLEGTSTPVKHRALPVCACSTCSLE